MLTLTLMKYSHFEVKLKEALTCAGKLYDCHDIVFEKLCSQMFSVHPKTTKFHQFEEVVS